MRILYVTAHYPPDFVSGATLQVQRLAERAAEAGHDVAVFSGAVNRGLADGETAAEWLNGVDVRWIGSAGWIHQDDDRNWDNPVVTARAAALLDELEPDVVHGHALQTLGAGVIDAALHRRTRVVLTMHDLWWWCSRLFLVDRDMRPCTLVTDIGDCPCARTSDWRAARAANLKRTLDNLAEILVPSRVMRDLVIANGIDPARVDVDENDVDVVPSALRRHAADGDVQFAYVGGDQPVKGVDVVLDAAHRLQGVSGWRLTCYGVAERPQLRRAPVTFAPGYEPAAAADVMSSTDVLVIPSIARESFSIAAREALIAGAAVITSDCIGPEEVVAHGRNGLVVPTGDADALAATMRRLVDDPDLLASLQTGAAASAPRMRSPSDHARAVLARYSGAPSTPPPHPQRIVLIADSTTSARAQRAADALRRRGIETQVVDDRDTQPVDGEPLPPGTEVVDAASVPECVSGAELRAAFTAPERRRRWPFAAPIIVAAVAGTATGWQGIESSVSEVLAGRRRTRLEVVTAADLDSLRGAAIVIVPPSLGARPWMLASLAGAATVVGSDIEPVVDHGRTALVARSTDEWAEHLTRLLDDPTERATMWRAAQRHVMLHHGPHSVAASILDAATRRAG